MRSLSRDEVRAVDRCAIDQFGIPGVVLMENAGRNAADAIEHFLLTALKSASSPATSGGISGQSVAIVAGAGNNGGDGYVIARHLAMRGAKVVTFLIAPREKISGDALVNLNIIEKLGHDIRPLADEDATGKLADMLASADLVVDAIGGTGIRGPLRGLAAEAVQQANKAAKPIVAVDIPTGLDCDSGMVEGPAIRAEMTVTFVARKKGFDAAESREYTGEVFVADIGVPAGIISPGG